MLGLGRRLKQAGVLGLNRRNADFVLPYNRRHLYPRVDDKLITKRLALEAGIAVPDLYGVIEVAAQARRAGRRVAAHADFVMKPAHGSGGDGVLVVTGRVGSHYRLADGSLIDDDDLAHHAQGIVSGIYSLGGQPDRAMIEYRVRFDPVFRDIAYEGVPDIRIIVFLGVPVMAMVRLPTRASGGKANLHQGAIGAGIDLATGRTLNAVAGIGVVSAHPDTGAPVAGVEIPHWPRLLELAARSEELTGLGYQGIDLVLDETRGPLMLELNARPGLNIQIANRAGLAPRLEAVRAARDGLRTLDERVDFARRSFALDAAGLTP